MMKNLCSLLLALLVCYNLVAQNEKGVENPEVESIGIPTNKKLKKNNFNIYADGGASIFLKGMTMNLEGRLFSTKSNVFHLYGRTGFGMLLQKKCKVRVVDNGGGGYGSLWGMLSVEFEEEKEKSRGGIAALTMLLGKKKHNFEASVGLFFGKKDKPKPNEDSFNPKELIELAYRYQNPEGGFLFRLKVGTLGIGAGLGLSF